MTSLGNGNGRGINPQHSIGLRVGNGGEPKLLYILSRNHICAVSTVNDDSAIFLSTLDKGIEDGCPSPILFWSKLGKSTSHYLNESLMRGVARIRSHDS